MPTSPTWLTEASNDVRVARAEQTCISINDVSSSLPAAAGQDLYICPNGKVLPRSSRKRRCRGDDMISYFSCVADCRDCPLKPRCCPKSPSRKITRHIHKAPCGLSLAEAVFHDGTHHRLSTFGCETGILMNVHSVLRRITDVLQPQLLSAGPNGQRPESSQLASANKHQSADSD